MIGCHISIIYNNRIGWHWWYHHFCHTGQICRTIVTIAQCLLVVIDLGWWLSLYLIPGLSRCDRHLMVNECNGDSGVSGIDRMVIGSATSSWWINPMVLWLLVLSRTVRWKWDTMTSMWFRNKSTGIFRLSSVVASSSTIRILLRLVMYMVSRNIAAAVRYRANTRYNLLHRWFVCDVIFENSFVRMSQLIDWWIRGCCCCCCCCCCCL